MHILCTICSDLVNQAENIYVTKCGHVFHHHCLAQWIERSKSCPQCRHKVTEKCMFRFFPTISNENTGDDAATLQSRLDDTTLQLRQQKTVCKEKEEKLNAIAVDLKRNEELLKSYEKKLVNRDSAISALKEQMEYLKVQNKETVKLKDENEDLKKSIQTLNGLQKVLNATSEEVEQMLQGYTDLKTIATFATALKRALCESESKKSESRDRLLAAKQQLGAEKKHVADLQANIMQLEDRLVNAERKYESLKNKRKASEVDPIADRSTTELNSPKQPRRSDPCDLNTAILNSSNSSLNSMVRRIEKADSPYLSLRQSSLALTALQRGPISIPTGNMKPSELAILNAARNATHATPKNADNITSIFYKKSPLQPELCDKPPSIDLDVSYDGLGGHSRLDTFPVPLQRMKSCVPKLTAKHKLKRPTQPDPQNIVKMLEKMRNK